MHDTVINTLGAIGALPIKDVSLVRRRCAADLAAVDKTSHLTSDASRLLAELKERATVLGIRLDVTAESGAESLPPDLGAALYGALSEALLNASKHSDPTMPPSPCGRTANRVWSSCATTEGAWAAGVSAGRRRVHREAPPRPASPWAPSTATGR